MGVTLTLISLAKALIPFCPAVGWILACRCNQNNKCVLSCWSQVHSLCCSCPYHILQCSQSLELQSSCQHFDTQHESSWYRWLFFQYSDSFLFLLSAKFFSTKTLIFILSNIIDCSLIHQAVLGKKKMRHQMKSSNLAQTPCMFQRLNKQFKQI